MKKTLYLLAILAFLLPSMTFASFDVSLKYGSKGDAVSELQDFLADQNVYTGKVDGKFGFGTLKAVKAFQEANNLSVDGYFGKASRGVAQGLLASDLKASDDAEVAETGSVSPAVVTMSGCTDTTGFSATTGKPCDGSTPAPVTDVNTQSAISALTQQVQTLTQATQQIASNTTPVVQPPQQTSIIEPIRVSLSKWNIDTKVIPSKNSADIFVTNLQTGDTVTVDSDSMVNSIDNSGRKIITVDENTIINPFVFSLPNTLKNNTEYGWSVKVQRENEWGTNFGTFTTLIDNS